MNRAVVCAGSNIDPRENIDRAREVLAGELICVAESRFAMTAPVGLTEQPDFLNGAFLVETEMDMDGLKTFLTDVEERLGRVRSEEKNGPRTIDLDIVVFNGKVVDDDFYRYDFVRRAVTELVPELGEDG